MKTRELGQTGVFLPEVGIGTWNYRAGPDPLRRGIEEGALLIDTAESYGTESVVGEAIKDVRDRVFLATKVSPIHFRRRDLLEAANGSLRRLKTDHVDLYQLHRPNYVVPIEETMGALEELVEIGKVRFIGVSNFSVGELKKAQAVLSRTRIVANQVRFSLVERSIELGLLQFCQKNSITVIAYSPLARGLENIRRRDPAGILGKVGAEVGRSEAEVALNWCTSRDRVVVIPKTASVSHMVQNCRAGTFRLSSDQLRLLDEGIGFKRRGFIESTFRSRARYILQHLGYQPGFSP
jgi:hypothetical protein